MPARAQTTAPAPGAGAAHAPYHLTGGYWLVARLTGHAHTRTHTMDVRLTPSINPWMIIDPYHT